jgi:hypothetical protein
MVDLKATQEQQESNMSQAPCKKVIKSKEMRN